MEVEAEFILVTAVTTSGVLFSKENAKFWPILGYFVENLCTSVCTFTGLDTVVVYQNGQMCGVS